MVARTGSLSPLSSKIVYRPGAQQPLSHFVSVLSRLPYERLTTKCSYEREVVTLVAEYITLSWQGTPNGATRAERQRCDYRAYVPDPLLGRPLTLTGQRAADVSDVERRLIELNTSERPLVSLEALARLLLWAEAVASSFIEGLQINVRRLAKTDVAERTGIEMRDDTAHAVLGNVRAMESALGLADAPAIHLDDVLELHRRLLNGTRDARFGGLIRTEQNWVGGTGMSACQCRLRPSTAGPSALAPRRPVRVRVRGRTPRSCPSGYRARAVRDDPSVR